MAVRAGIVVTGTEVLTARTTDRNGPWLSEQLQGVGLEVAWITTVGELAAHHAASANAQRFSVPMRLPQPSAPQAPADASIDLRAVDFRYEPGAPEVLRGVRLRNAPGSGTPSTSDATNATTSDAAVGK